MELSFKINKDHLLTHALCSDFQPNQSNSLLKQIRTLAWEKLSII